MKTRNWPQICSHTFLVSSKKVSIDPILSEVASLWVQAQQLHPQVLAARQTSHPYLESSTSMDDRFDKNPQVSSSFSGFIPFQANSKASGARII